MFGIEHAIIQIQK